MVAGNLKSKVKTLAKIVDGLLHCTATCDRWDQLFGDAFTYIKGSRYPIGSLKPLTCSISLNLKQPASTVLLLGALIAVEAAGNPTTTRVYETIQVQALL